MAVGFPTKVTYANGDVFSASDINDTNGTVNLINPSAKGDLFVGSAANTYTKLSVGANDTSLVANSSAATGMSWQGSWTTYTPTFTNLTVGNGTTTFRYQQIGKTVFVRGLFTLGSTSSVSGLIDFTVPVTMSSTNNQWFNQNCLIYISNFFLANVYPKSTSALYLRANYTGGTYATTADTSATVPATWTTSQFFSVNFHYEAA